jgi:hypothetical protein
MTVRSPRTRGRRKPPGLVGGLPPACRSCLFAMALALFSSIRRRCSSVRPSAGGLAAAEPGSAAPAGRQKKTPERV